VDSGSTNHVCNSLQGFQETRRLNEGEMYLTLGDGTRVPVHSIGIIKLYYINRPCLTSLLREINSLRSRCHALRLANIEYHDMVVALYILFTLKEYD
jgi:hypothetical protein